MAEAAETKGSASGTNTELIGSAEVPRPHVNEIPYLNKAEAFVSAALRPKRAHINALVPRPIDVIYVF